MSIANDIKEAKKIITAFPTYWEAKACILEMKQVDRNWRQMEWCGFYFEHLFRESGQNHFSMPGDRIDRVSFDMKAAINWDLKMKAVNSGSEAAILNDSTAIDKAIASDGYYGAMMALCDVEYNDVDRSFQLWHENLKGGPSAYTQETRQRTTVSRLRKTKAKLEAIVFITIDKAELGALKQMNQGRNSNGRPRPPKYMLSLKEHSHLIRERVDFY